MGSVYKIFGNNVYKYRKMHNLTQQQLADLVEVTPSYIGLIENGKTSTSFQIIEMLTQALGVKVAALFEESEDDIEYAKESTIEYNPQTAKLYLELKQLLQKYEQNMVPGKNKS